MSSFALPQGLYKVIRDVETDKYGIASEFVVKDVKLPFELEDGVKISFITKFNESKHEVIREIYVVDRSLADKNYKIIKDVKTDRYGIWFYDEEKPIGVKLPMGVIKDNKQVIITFARYGSNLPSNYEVVE